mmetsp:Transcript_65406/g.181457  ORF Transcript_65406/g.181457 Transcript_65406/m.181457 type:complete len:388 (+) Transcript_65406:74-1237(+)
MSGGGVSIASSRSLPASESHVVEVGDRKLQVFVHPERGPLVYTLDGNYGYLAQQQKGYYWGPYHKHGSAAVKPWSSMAPTEREIQLIFAAKKNLALLDFKGAEFFANARLPSKHMIAAAQRALGMGDHTEFLQEDDKLPVLCCWYSGGLDPNQGREQLEPIVKAARKAGLKHVLVLDYPDTYGIEGEGSAPWAHYVDRLVREVDAEPERRGRELLLFGHSRGATPAMTVAARLGQRVLKVYVASSGGPLPDQPSPFKGLSDYFKAKRDLDLLKWFCSLNPVPTMLRIMESVQSGEIAIEDSQYLADKLTLMKRHYVNAIWPDMQTDFKVLAVPILAVAGKRDASLSKQSMDMWKLWSTKEVKVKLIEAGHMDTANHTDIFISDMVKL